MMICALTEKGEFCEGYLYSRRCSAKRYYIRIFGTLIDIFVQFPFHLF